jgi:excisionase family DNA binding protein
MNKALMKVAVAAWRLSASESFVYQLINDGRLKHYRLGTGQGGLRVSEEQLQEYLATQEEGGASRPKPERAAPARKTLKHLSLD